MVHIEHGVVVQGGRGRSLVGSKFEIVLSGVLPPRLKRLLVEVGAVSVVVKPQTEASSSQSKWPDFGVLSMAADRCCQPLIFEVCGDL